MDRCDSARLDARRLMTPDSFSDLALFLVCLGILHRCWWVQTDRAAIGLAGLLIGFAAALGVLRFSTWTEIGDLVKGVHQFASVLAAVAGFPMLALGLIEHQECLPLLRQASSAEARLGLAAHPLPSC